MKRNVFAPTGVLLTVGVLWFAIMPAVDPAFAASVVARWVGSSGNWSVATNWDIGQVPNNSGGTTYSVILDVAGSDATVTVNQAITISGLVTYETLQITSGGTFTLSGGVTNAGTMSAATGGTLRFSGTTAGNEGGMIAADSGIVQIIGSVVSGGALRVTDDVNSRVLFSGDVTLNGVGWEDLGAGEFRVEDTTARLVGGVPAGQRLVVWSSWLSDAQLTLRGGVFTNAGVIELRSNYDSCRARLYVEASATLAGAGEVVLAKRFSWAADPVVSGATNVVLTVGSGQRVHGVGQIQVPLVNQGILEADQPGQALTISGQLDNQSTLSAVNGGTLNLDPIVAITGLGRITGEAAGTMTVGQDLLGDTQNASQYSPLAKVVFDGSGSAASPQLLEVMGRDLGLAPAGFNRNFVYSTLSLGNNTYVRLLDRSTNSAGTGAEAFYVNSLIVPAGTTLDLNGLHLYARLRQLSGTVVGGSVIQVPDSGPLVLSSPTPATISTAGELDEWTFFGRAGRSVTVIVDPGGSGSPALPPPYLAYAKALLLDPGGNTLATGTNRVAGEIVAFYDVALPTDGIYRVQVHAPAEHAASSGNYLITVWDATADVTMLPLNQQRGGTIETPYSADRWEFSGVAGQQIRFDLISASGRGIAFDLKGPNGWVGFSNLVTDSDLVTLPSSGGYTLTAHGMGGQYGVTYAFRVQETTVTDLMPDTVYQGTFVGSGQAQLFRVNVTNSHPMHVVLNDSDPRNRNELYVRFGAPPTRADYDYRFPNTSSADQQVVVPVAPAGTWYVLVYSELTAGPGSTFTLVSYLSDLLLTSVTPTRHAIDQPVTLTLTGAGFVAGTVVELVATNGTAYPAAPVQVDSFTQITATFAPNRVPVGRYALRVSRVGADTSELADAFEAVSIGGAKLETNLIVPAQLGYHTVATIYVEYRNTGNSAMPAPLLVLTATQNGKEGARLTLQNHRLVEGFWTAAQPEGFSHSIQILASGDTPGVLQPGDSVRVPVYYAGWQQPWDFHYPPMNWNLGVLRANDTNAVNWAALKESMKPATINAEAWDVIWAGFTNQVGTTWGDYVRMLDDNATYLGRLGQRVVDVGQLLGFEFLQADGLSPLRTLASAVDAAVEAPGLPLVFSRFFPASIAQRFELGRLGRGWSHNWQYSLTNAPDGTVAITGPGGSRRVFQPDSRTTNNPASTRYFAQPGDHATLTSLGGGVFTLIEPAGLLRTFRSDGKLDYVEDPNGNRINCDYSGTNLASLTHSSGQQLTIGYGAGGCVASITDHLGRQTVLNYDGANEHLLSAQYYDGRTASYAYAGAPASSRHALTEVANSCCTRRYFTYDTQGRLSSTHRDDNAEAVTFSYDTTGTVTATHALTNSGQFYFDHRGLLVKAEDALGNAVHLAFDDDYNLVRLTDPAGRSYNYGYDGKGNLTQSTDPLGHASRFTYQAVFNRLTSVADANSNVTSYAYTGAGNLESITYADTNHTHEDWVYDALGNAITWTNRRGTNITYAYDLDGRLTNKVYHSDGSQAIYAYDPHGNLTSAEILNAEGLRLNGSSMTYDAADRLARIDFDDARWLAFTYDSAGRRASSLDQLGHLLTYHYDGAGRLESMTNELSQLVVRYEYDAAGRLARKTLGNGMVATYVYDPAGQLLTLTNRLADGTAISWFNYAYDTRGRRTAMATHYGAWAYDYDDLGQLTRAVLNSTDPQIPSQDLAYVYDALGNRIRTIENGVTTEYTANNLNQYVQRSEVGGQRSDYVFDLDGNLIAEIIMNGGQRTTNTFVYNDENRLIAVTQDASLWQYAYDALGNRVATAENGVTKRFMVDPIGLGNVVGEYDGTGNLLAHYDHGLGLLSRTAATNNPVYYTFDAIGSTHQLVTSTGAIANAYACAPFGGSLMRTETIQNPFQLVGEYGVAVDLGMTCSMRLRIYDAELGQFTTEDPMGHCCLSGRLYVENDPVSFIDPSGLHRRRAPGKPRTVIDRIRDLGRGFVDYLIGRIPGVGMLRAPGRGIGLGSRLGQITEDFLGGSVLDENPDVEGFAKEYYGELMKTILPFPARAIINECQEGTSQAVGVRDPNAKTGPAGFGANGFITASGTLAYRVDFENEANASAPAQQVVITDQLSGSLDWGTFQLTEVGFGDQLIVLPPNLQHFETNVPMSYLGTDFEVQLEAGINLNSGQVYAILRSIDPATSLPPPVNIGFLPPEDGTGRGRGHVSYTINAKPNLPTSTEIRNVAYISFDLQPAIGTNWRTPHDPTVVPAKECLNTIDASPPVGSVDPLPATSTSPFRVSWREDPPDIGAGTANYDIYVTTDGGSSWALLLENTTDISTQFAGQIGRTYGFCCVARDNVGNVEEGGLAVEASTTVVATGLIVEALDMTPSGFVVRFNQALDDSVLNLYDAQTNRFGPPDLTVVGNTSGTNAGSLLYDPEMKTVHFVRTNTLLPPDSYTITLRSDTNAFKASDGTLLDGDRDNVPGGDYVTNVTVADLQAPVLSLPDFARGPGQVVHVPVTGTNTGIPVTLSDGAGVTNVDFVLEYDPKLLLVTGVLKGTDLPMDWTVVTQGLSTTGRVAVSVAGPSPLAAGALEVARIEAEVPEDAPYGTLGILSVSEVTIDGSQAAMGDSAVHVVAYLGDASGNQSYDSADADPISRVAVGLDSGFAAYRVIDPVIVADVSGDGRLSPYDAALVLQKAAGQDVLEIPPLPSEPPTLGIARTNSQLVISWRQSSRASQLEASDSLAPINWAPLTDSPAALGYQRSVTLDLVGSTKFYRVRKP